MCQDGTSLTSSIGTPFEPYPTKADPKFYTTFSQSFQEADRIVSCEVFFPGMIKIKWDQIHDMNYQVLQLGNV